MKARRMVPLKDRKKVRSFPNKSLFIIGTYRYQLPKLLGFFLLVSAMDVMGIGLIGPFIGLLASDGALAFEISSFVSVFVGRSLDHTELIALLGLVLCGLFILKGIVSFFVQREILKFGYRVRESIIDKIICSYQMMDYELLVKKNSSQLVVHASTHAGLFVDSVLTPFLRLLIESFVLLGILFLLLNTNLFLTICWAALFGLVLGVYYMLSKKKLFSCGLVMSKAETSIIRTLNYVFSGYKEIKLYSVEKIFREKINENLLDFSEAGVTSRSMHLIARYCIEVTTVIGVVSSIIVMQKLGASESEIFSVLGVFAIAAVRSVPSINAISLGLTNIKTGAYATEALFEEMQSLRPTKGQSNNFKAEDLEIGFLSICFNNVAYKYKSENGAVVTVENLELNHGDFIGIVGRSGSGKSTLVDLMLGMLKPDSGDIFINGSLNYPLHSTEVLHWWQRQCAFIPQSQFLLDSTVEANVTVGENSQITDVKRVIASLKLAGLLDFATDDATGLKRFVGENGALLSGGQRQRLSIARAFYTGRKILFLDEATSALDQATRREVLATLLSLKGKATIVLVTHNTSLLDVCDRIYEVEQGLVKKIEVSKDAKR
jgi:ABC-type bacteriocin/lantibiotic exporter with double-glycine peptidase domain